MKFSSFLWWEKWNPSLSTICIPCSKEVWVYNYTSMNRDRPCKRIPQLFCLVLISCFSTIQFYTGKLNGLSVTPNKFRVVLWLNYSERSGAKPKLTAGAISVTNLQKKKRREKWPHIEECWLGKLICTSNFKSFWKWFTDVQHNVYYPAR